jgi:EcsC family protein
VPKALWQRLREDPVRAPEHLALAAAEVHGPAAAAWLARVAAERQDGGRGLAGEVVRRHTRYARLTGGAMGVGGFTTMLADVASLAWIQSRMVFFVAAAFGWDPLDPMRPAELLVLQGIYDDPYEARAALDGTGTTVAETYVAKLAPGERDRRLMQRLLKMVGRRGAKRLGGKAIPGFAIAVNALGNGSDTKDLGRRTLAFFGGAADEPV